MTYIRLPFHLMVGHFQLKLGLQEGPLEASGPAGLVVERVVVVQLEVVQTDWVVDVTQTPAYLKLFILLRSKIIKTKIDNSYQIKWVTN